MLTAAPFTFDVQTPAVAADLLDVVAGWGVLQVTVPGFLATDTIQQMSFTAKPISGTGPKVEHVVTSSLTADGQIVAGADSTQWVGKFTLTPTDVANILATPGGYTFRVRVWAARVGVTFQPPYRDVLGGRITAAPNVTDQTQVIAVDHITVTGTATGSAGQVVTLTATAYDKNNNAISGIVFTWASATLTVATVLNGQVTFIAPGTSLITATAYGVTGSLTVTTSGLVIALGDVLYGSAPNVVTNLAGNTAAQRKYLSQTGTGAASAAPAWQQIGGNDLAALTQALIHNVQLAPIHQILTSEAGHAFYIQEFEQANGFGQTRKDLVLSWGYNVGQSVGQAQGGEHSTSFSIESYWATSATDAQTEIYLQHTRPNGTQSFRPFAVNITVQGPSANTTPNIDWLFSLGSMTWRDQLGVHTGLTWSYNPHGTGTWVAEFFDDVIIHGVLSFSGGVGTINDPLCNATLQSVSVSTGTFGAASVTSAALTLAVGLNKGIAFSGLANALSYDNSNFILNVGGADGTVGHGVAIRIVQRTVFDAAGATYDGEVAIDATNHRLIFYTGGARYYCPGTAF